MLIHFMVIKKLLDTWRNNDKVNKFSKANYLNDFYVALFVYVLIIAFIMVFALGGLYS